LESALKKRTMTPNYTAQTVFSLIRLANEGEKSTLMSKLF